MWWFRRASQPNSERFVELLSDLHRRGLMPAQRNAVPPGLTRLAVLFFSSAGAERHRGDLELLLVASKALELPCSVFLVALYYAERVRELKPQFFDGLSVVDVYAAAVLTAIKYLHDEDQEEMLLTNAAVAKAARLSPRRMLQLELAFLAALGWNCSVREEDFQEFTSQVETKLVTCALEVDPGVVLSYQGLSALTNINTLKTMAKILGGAVALYILVVGASMAVQPAWLTGTYSCADRCSPLHRSTPDCQPLCPVQRAMASGLQQPSSLKPAPVHGAPMPITRLQPAEAARVNATMLAASAA